MTTGQPPEPLPEPPPEPPPQPPPEPHRRVSDQPRDRRTWAFRIIIALSVLLIGIYYAARQSDSWLIHWQRHTVVRDLASLYVRVNAIGLPVSGIGRVQVDGAWLPVLAVRRAVPGANARACVFSGVHGNEPASVEASLRFAESLVKDATQYAGVNITVVPLVNPWGWARNLRRNGANQDISRSFFSNPSAEGEMVKALLKGEHCDMLVDLHGDSSRQAFHIITYENANLAVAKSITREVKARGLPLRMGAVDAVFNRHDKDAVNAARPSLGLYARRNGVPQSYLVQSPRELDIETRVSVHLLVLDRLVRAVKLGAR